MTTKLSMAPAEAPYFPVESAFQLKPKNDALSLLFATGTCPDGPCDTPVEVGLFFDGTNNNLDRDLTGQRVAAVSDDELKKIKAQAKATGKRIAETRAAPLVAQWKARIAAARGQSDPYIDAALQWSKDYDTNPSPDVVRSLIEDEARKLAQIKGSEAGATFYAIATGTQTPMGTLYTDWAAQLTLAPKTIDQMKKDVKAMVDHFGTIEKVTSASVREWIKGLMQDKPSKKG